MSERVWSEKDLVRRANRRLAVLQHAEKVSGSVAATCRYYGISRTVFYRWKKRYEDEGLDGLKDRSSAPMHCPNTTPPEVVAKIIHLRQHYHFGPLKVSMYLKRYYQYTAIDDCARLRVLRIYPRSDQKTAIQFFDYAASRLPFTIEQVQTDNGAEFKTACHWHLLDHGIGHTYIRPATPRLNGKVESSPHRRRRVLPTAGRHRHRRRRRLQRQSCANGRTTSTTTDPTAGQTARPPTRNCYKQPEARSSPTVISSTPSHDERGPWDPHQLVAT